MRVKWSKCLLGLSLLMMMGSLTWGKPLEQNIKKDRNPFASLLFLQSIKISTPPQMLRVPQAFKAVPKPRLRQTSATTQPKIKLINKKERTHLAIKKQSVLQKKKKRQVAIKKKFVLQKKKKRQLSKLAFPKSKILDKTKIIPRKLLPKKKREVVRNPTLPSLPQTIAAQFQWKLIKLNRSYGKKRDASLNHPRISQRSSGSQGIRKQQFKKQSSPPEELQISPKRKVVPMSIFPSFSEIQITTFQSELLALNRSFQITKKRSARKKVMAGAKKRNVKQEDLQDRSHKKIQSQAMILKGIVATSQGRYAMVRIGRENHIVSEGEQVLKKQILEIREDQMVLLAEKKQEVLNVQE